MTFFFVRILGGLSRKVGHQLADWLANDLPGDEDQFNSEQPVPQPTWSDGWWWALRETKSFLRITTKVLATQRNCLVPDVKQSSSQNCCTYSTMAAPDLLLVLGLEIPRYWSNLRRMWLCDDCPMKRRRKEITVNKKVLARRSKLQSFRFPQRFSPWMTMVQEIPTYCFACNTHVSC